MAGKKHEAPKKEHKKEHKKEEKKMKHGGKAEDKKKK